MSVPDVAASYWKSTKDGELLVGGNNISAIVARHGTPVFVYDSAIVERKLALLREALPSRFSISYSVKANPNPAFLHLFVEKGCGLEIASAGEFHIAESIGCSPKDIIFAGPGKTEEELQYVIARGIGEIHAESEVELRRINAISSNLGLRAKVALRVNPDESGQGGAMQMGGKSAPFGIDEEYLTKVLDLFAYLPHVEFRGIHLFVGTQITDASLLLAQYKKGIEIGRRAAEYMNRALETLDFGGGLGVPYFPGEPELDLHALHEGLRQLIAEAGRERAFDRTRFMVEPGRFLVAESGIYVARINDIKVSRGKKYLIIDGGMNHHLAASGNLGQVIKRNFPVAIINKLNVQPTELVDVVGPLCTPLDTVARSVRVPPVEIGDLFGIFHSGAYARTASPLGFLSHRTPPEVWVEGDQDFLIRVRGNQGDHIADTRQASIAERVA